MDKKYKKIYFMGIKGVGMATLAVIAKEAGFIVGGSDIEEEFITDKILKKAAIEIKIGFQKGNVRGFFGTNPKSECLFIATAAHEGFDNDEAVFARETGYRVISHGEAVGVFMSGDLFGRMDLEGVSVAGSHGKTTITGMIAVCLSKLNTDPSYTAGTSEIFPIGSAGHYGGGKYFIAEADEYLSEMKLDRNPKFLYQNPKHLIINNIDFDHPDFFKDIDAVISAYSEFVSKLSPESTPIVNGDDENIKKISNIKARSITYGTGEGNEFRIVKFSKEGFGSQFEVLRNNTSLGYFKLSVPGYHNAKNALSVIALLMELGISARDIQTALPQFEGVKRRLEKIGELAGGALVYDDYAHHPEEIRKTLEAVSGAYPDKKITIVFQAHTYGRTRALISEFISSFAGVSELIILPTFASARDRAAHGLEEDQNLVDQIRMVQSNVKLIETQEGVIEYIRKNVSGSDKIIITMGAGDVYKVGYSLITQQ